MAGIDNLKSRILKDDEAYSKQIIEEAEAKAGEIMKSSKERAEVILKEAQIKAEKDGSDRKERIIARAQLDARNNKLATKQEIIDKVLCMAEEKINSMNKEEYTSFIEKLLLNSVETGNEEVIFSDKDKVRLDQGLIARVNDRLVSQNKTGKLRIGETGNIKSGFVLKNGGIEINCSIDSQIRILRDSLEGELANLLFEDR